MQIILRRSVRLIFAPESESHDSLTDPGTQPIGQCGANCTVKVQLIKTVVVPDEPTGEIESHARLRDSKRENSVFKKGGNLMNTTMKPKRHSRALLLSILCAGVVATFLGGCAEGPYMTAYDTGYTYPTTYYTPYSYDYYNGYPSSYYYGPTTRYYTRYGTTYYDNYGY